MDIAQTAVITAIVTTLVNNAAAADSSAVGRAWGRLQAGFFPFADRAAPVLALLAGLLVVLWFAVRVALLRTKQDIDVLKVDPRLPNPMTVLVYSAVLLLGAALTLLQAANGSNISAAVACCVGLIALRSALRFTADVRRTVFGSPF